MDRSSAPAHSCPESDQFLVHLPATLPLLLVPPLVPLPVLQPHQQPGRLVRHPAAVNPTWPAAAELHPMVPAGPSSGSPAEAAGGACRRARTRGRPPGGALLPPCGCGSGGAGLRQQQVGKRNLRRFNFPNGNCTSAALLCSLMPGPRGAKRKLTAGKDQHQNERRE
jgi:hypothetical protein